MDYMAEIFLNYQTIHIDELIGPKGKKQKSMRDLPPEEVYEYAAEEVSESLEVDGVEIACVSGSFPSSQALIEVKVAETALAVKDGATEIDIVMPVGKFLSGDYEGVCDDISELKEACGEAPMKVILETGDLKTGSNIKKASILSMYAGADYIKTSTGKEKISATPEAAYIMCQAIKEYYDKTGIQIGFKPAGGLNTRVWNSTSITATVLVSGNKAMRTIRRRSARHERY